MDANELCTALNDLLHQHRWVDADTFLREAVARGESSPVLIALAMISSGAAEHLPARALLFEHVLLHEEMDPRTRAAVERMASRR